MKPAPFEWHAPESLDDALALLAGDEEARPLAGGQSLMPMMAMRVLSPATLVDLNGIDSLEGVTLRPDGLHIGAMTRQRALERDARLRARCPLLVEALAHVGHRQTRNRGTFGGSLAHLDPSAELPAVALALDGVVHVRSAEGQRDVPMAEFPRDLLTPDLATGELVTGISLPCWCEGHGHAFEEFARRRGDFAIVAVAALVELDEDECIRRAAVAVAGAGPVVQRAAAVESVLVGSRGDEAVAEAAARSAELETMDDVHAPARYRTHLAGTLVERALRRALSRAGPGAGA